MSNDVLQQLVERVTRLELELHQLKDRLGKEKAAEQPWWEKIAGSQKGDKAFAEIARLGAQIRRDERKGARGEKDKQPSRKRRVKVHPGKDK